MEKLDEEEEKELRKEAAFVLNGDTGNFDSGI